MWNLRNAKVAFRYLIVTWPFLFLTGKELRSSIGRNSKQFLNFVPL